MRKGPGLLFGTAGWHTVRDPELRLTAQRADPYQGSATHGSLSKADALSVVAAELTPGALAVMIAQVGSVIEVSL